jgi:hypothetical protein
VGLILPIFILTVVAVLEFGYFAAVASAVNTASREGARYGSTVDDTSGTPHYLDCDGIRDHARDLSDVLATMADADIVIRYQSEAGTMYGFTCDDGPDVDDLERFDRVVVEVTYEYSPVTPVIGGIIGDRTLVSIDRRSIMKPCVSC